MRASPPYLLLAALLAAGCQTTSLTPGGSLPPPQNLSYELAPSGTPTQPTGILLTWDDVQQTGLASYRVYSRASTTSSFGLRGETSSNTFHDNGIPHLQYYVTAVDVDGGESAPSAVVTVNEYLQIPRPTALAGISLNQAIHLDWDDTPALSNPNRFKWYRVYSASATSNPYVCKSDWLLEGTTVSPEFLVGVLSNGVPLCFAVSAVDRLGYESLWSPLWADTPRPDARNVLAYAFATKVDSSGFRFWDDLNGNGVGDPGELGLIQNGSRADIDFVIHRNAADSTLWIVPVFSGTTLQLYGAGPVADLTAIDLAPASGYARDSIQALPGYGYVFQIADGAALHYGALRVTHVGRQYLIFDWSVQTDPGNPELAPKRVVAAAR